MFGSTNPFGQSSTSPFGSQPAFGQTSTSPFGSQPAFGQTNNNPFAPKPFGSTTPFGSNTGSSLFGGTSTGVFGATQSSPLAASSPAFGSTASAFGASSTSAFGSSSLFGQKSAFGGFGTTTPQASPFGSSFQQPSQPAFGSSLFGSSTPFGAQSQPAFGTPSTPTFGTSTTPAFGTSTTPAFGTSTTPAFGASTTPSFGTTNSSPFGLSSASIFGSSTPGFGTTSTPAFGTTPTPAFGQSAPAFNSNPFNATPSSSAFGVSASTPPFGGQSRGSRVAPYQPTPETDGGSTSSGKIESISAMPVYKEKSHEELRFEDYQAGDKGGPAKIPQPSGSIGFAQTSANPFSSNTTPSPFAPKTAFGVQTTSAFGNSSTPSLFGPSSPAGSIFGTSPSLAPGSTPSLFGPSSTPGFGQSTTPAISSSLAFNTQSAPLFQSTSSGFGQTGAFGQTGSAFGQTTSSIGQSSSPFGQSNLFNTPSTGFGNLFSSTPAMQNSTNPLGFGQTSSSLSTLFQPTQPTQNNNTTGFGGQNMFSGQNMFGQNNNQQPPATQNTMVVQPAPAVSNPFGTLPAVPQMSIGRTGNSSSIQYGISNLPVIDKPAPVRISSLLTSRHISQRRPRLPARNYHPKPEEHKVAFFTDDEEPTSTAPKADAFFVPRENPRALVIRPLDTWPSKAPSNGVRNGENKITENGTSKESVKEKEKPLTGHRAGEAAIVYEHGADIEALMPKLRNPDYYTVPKIQELAAKERAEPGLCRRVPDFVVGRQGFGSIRFLGETDVRGLDLESIVQFNHREVVVYMDESKKPAVGQGLNKPAEVTLLNIKCVDKKTGQSYSDGPRVDKYREMLRRKAEDQGAEFVSFDPVKGEWKFRVKHFSKYWVGEDEDEEENES